MQQVTLREARQRRGLTQKELEARSGVPQAHISRIELGHVEDPASSTVLKLAHGLRMDPRALKFGVQESLAS